MIAFIKVNKSEVIAGYHFFTSIWYRDSWTVVYGEVDHEKSISDKLYRANVS